MAKVKKEITESNSDDQNQKEVSKVTPQQLGKVATETMSQFSKAADRAVSASSRATNPAKLAGELSNLDFRTMIGGPLQAAIDAQIASSMAAVEFINKVGFTETGTAPNIKKELIYVDFTHETSEYVTNPDGTVNPTPQTTKKYMKVPFLAMLQIPSLRIEYVDINFKAKLNSVETSETKTTAGGSVEGKAGWGPVSMKVTASYQRQASTGVKIEREFALDVKVRAVQDEMPKGLEMILNAIS
ncbi:MAG: DUF2589 domain-containing protein [Saprospiraceae bacterium]|nr:DUF2589 domain-containing protein [Saprospiraceae bacterium]